MHDGNSLYARLSDGTTINIHEDGLMRLSKDGQSCLIHHDSMINAVSIVEKNRGAAVIDYRIDPDSFSYIPHKNDKNSLTFVDDQGNSVSVNYKSAREFAAERIKQYMTYLLDHAPSDQSVFLITENVLGFIESIVLDDEDILNQSGWVMMRKDPLEIFHPQSGSQASGEGAMIVMAAIRKMRIKF